MLCVFKRSCLADNKTNGITREPLQQIWERLSCYFREPNVINVENDLEVGIGDGIVRVLFNDAAATYASWLARLTAHTPSRDDANDVFLAEFHDLHSRRIVLIPRHLCRFFPLVILQYDF